jgi:hypothetical protein
MKQPYKKHYPEAVATTAEAVHNAFDSDGQVKALLQIEGLALYRHDEVTGVNIFELSGLQHRQCDMREAMKALGITDEELASNSRDIDLLGEKLFRVVQDHDLLNLLRTRVKFIG